MPEGLKTSGDDEPTPEQLRDHGYAPGGYMVKCRDCGERPWDLDKRATRCKACATAAWRKYSMEAALAAQATKGGGIPDGWVLVPKEPTPWMIDKGSAARAATGLLDGAVNTAATYKAAIAAAPSPPTSLVEDLSGLLAYAEMRCDLYIHEAQRLALLVRKLGGNPEPNAAPSPPTAPALASDGRAGKPVAWAWECCDAGNIWTPRVTLLRPADNPWHRHIRPLYEAPAAPVGDLAGLSEKPCHWGGGNDIIWCSTCGAEYAYAKGEARPACPRETAALLPAAHRETAEGIPSEAQLELAAVREMLLADQGDDDDTQILPDIKEDMSLSTMVARCISLLEYRRDVIKAVFDQKSVWVKKYQELCENIKSEEAGGGFDAKASIAENFPQIASEYPNAKAADPVAHGQTVTAEEIARTIATAYGHGHPLGLTSGDGLEYWRANRDRHMKEAHAVLALLPAAHRETATEEEIARALREVLGLFDRDGALSCSGGHQVRVVASARALITAPRAEGETQYAKETQAARDVLSERRRQVEAEGWTPAHDDKHSRGEIAKAAAAYAMPSTFRGLVMSPYSGDTVRERLWPWDEAWWKPARLSRERRRDLVKAGALILAEIERLDRAASPDAVQTNGGER